jgi:two-component sensor histidine kinase
MARGDQLRVEGPEIVIGPNTATSLALVLHELATNAAKYGALSVSEGCLDVRWQAEGDQLSLSWQELNGPAIQAPPERNGFGSQLVRMSAGGQLGGSITYDWASTGVLIILRIPLERLQR